MSDYLGNLVARTFNQARMLQPRLPGLFEPPPAAGEWESSVNLSREAMSAPAAVQEFESAIPASSSQELSSPQADPPGTFPWPPGLAALKAPQPDRIEAGTSRQIKPDLSQPPTLDPPSLILIQPSRAGHQPSRSTVPDSDIHPILKPEARISQAAILPSSSIKPEASSEKPETFMNSRVELQLAGPSTPMPIVVLPPVKSARQVAPTEMAAVEPAISPTSPTILTPIVIHPQVTSTRQVEPTELASAEPAATIAPPAPPTIRVTIGRVEVRAVLPVPPPPARSASPPAPHLSLDDYLRSRTGGAR